MLPQNPDDLLFREPARFHVHPPSEVMDSTQIRRSFRGSGHGDSPNAEIVAVSMNPDDTEKRHGMMSHHIRRKNWTVRYKPPRTEATFKETMKGAHAKK